MSSQVDQPRLTPNRHQRRVQPREDRIENNEFNHEVLDEDGDQDSSQRRYGGQFRKAWKREELVHDGLLVTWRDFSKQPKNDGDDEHQEHIFQTRCQLKDKVCAL